MTLMMNDKVRAKNDPRHVGVVKGFFSGNMVKVIWGESEWIEFIDRHKLERVSDGTEYLLNNRR